MDEHKKAIMDALRKYGYGWEFLGLFLNETIAENSMTDEDVSRAITSLVKDGVIQVTFMGAELGIEIVPGA